MNGAAWKAAAIGLALVASSSGADARDGVVSEAAPPLVTRQYEIAMVRGSIWNPWTLTHDPVDLRSYRGEGIRDGDFVAPPIRVRPGQALRMRLDNRLPPCTEEEQARGPCINDTNLHTHGLWVSPAGNSDNVMIAIPPGARFDYEFRIPEEHPAGTFWYHPHRHGSGMFQIGSGMAGALIVEGDRLPTADRPGDVDILLKDDRGRPFPERVLVFQRIPYACAFEEDGWPRAARDGDGHRVGPYDCRPGEVGRIERVTQFAPAPDGARPGRYFSVNGRVQPLVRGALAGRFERWRIVNAAPAGLIRFGFRLLLPNAPDLSTIPADEQQQWLERYCTGPMLPAWQLAHDGLTRSEIRRAEQSTVAPGGRLDLLTRFPEPGRYCLLQMSETGTGNSGALGLIDVTGRAVRAADDVDAELRRLLVRAAGRALRGEQHAAVRGRVVADLENELRLDAFVPHPAITNAELTGHQAVEFRTVGPEHAMTFEVDRRRFDHGRIDRFVPLGGVEEWRLSVPPDASRHTFHIHVNPFQIVSIRNERGEDMTDPASPAFNSDYAGLPAQWLDSIVLYPGTTVLMRTRYERFIGDTMLHCHVAHHADLGMMQHVRIYIPGSPEGPDAPQHDHASHR